MHPLSSVCSRQIPSLHANPAADWRNPGPGGGLAGEPGNHPKANPPTTTSHTHSPFPQSTHTCAWVWASLGCQSEPQEPQSCSAVWSNKIWGFLSHSGAAHKTHTCANGYTNAHIHIHEYTVHSCCGLAHTTDGDLILCAALTLPTYWTELDLDSRFMTP